MQNEECSKMTHKSEEVLAFWFEECKPEVRFNGSDTLDEDIRSRFLSLWEEGAAGKLGDWASHPRKALALVILLDQFPRNMFRGSAKAFSTDQKARAAACRALKQGWDKRFDEEERRFFYMPFLHSELVTDQDHGVRLMCERMPETKEISLLHAQAHREIIRRFGRFPFRNDALGRRSSDKEKEFIQAGGYGKVVEELREKV